MKKFISILLALMLVMSLGTAAFAVSGDSYTDATQVTIHKTYKLVGDGSNPAETFTLEQVGDGVVSESDAASAPHLGTITGAAFNAGEATAEGVTHEITVMLPSYEKVGVYTYTLKEVNNNNNAGVSYFANDITLVVTVVNGENGTLRIAGVHTQGIGEGTEKSDTFENTYSAGTLKVSKTVGGNLGDKSKYFEFKVTLTGEEGKTYADSFAVSGGSYEQNPQTASIGENTFYLKDGDTISIANLPYGVTYTVTETAVEGYETTKTGDSGTINAAAQTAAFTNIKEGDIDTGISLDSLPYILMLVVVGAAIVVVSTRKKGEQF